MECIPAPHAGDAWRGIFEEHVLPMLPWLRGEPVFRGHAVDGGHHAFALLSPAGTCTAALAAAFGRRGHAAIGGDLLRVDVSGPRVEVQSYEDVVCGWDDIAAASGQGAMIRVVGPPSAAAATVGYVPPAEGAGVPLSQVYLVGDSDVEAPRVSPLSPRQQLRGWAATAFVPAASNPDVLERTLAAAAWLVGEVPMRGLDYPRCDDALDDVVDAVLADLAA